MKRGFALIALAAVLFTFQGAAVADDNVGTNGLSPSSFEFSATGANAVDLMDPTAVARAMREAKQRHAELISKPSAVTERRESVDEFTDLGSSAAVDLITNVFEEPLVAVTSLPSDYVQNSETRPVFVGGTDTSVRINPPGPEDSLLVVSDTPLRNEDNQLVSGELVATDGGFAPAAPLANAQIPVEADKQFELPDVDVAFSFPSASASTGRLVDAAVGDGREMVMYPNTQTDTDTAITYTLEGVETFNFLRSEDSPESIKIDYSLPNGATLTPTTDGGASIVDVDGEPLATVFPPYAVDAQDTGVPMTLEVVGSSLVLDVPHRGKGFAYPIMVDPVTHVRDWWTNGSTGFEGWTFTEEGTTNYGSSTSCPAAVPSTDPCKTGTGSGVYVTMLPGTYYPANSKAYWRWTVPGGTDSYIASAEMNTWRYREGADTYGWAFYNIYNGTGVNFTSPETGGGMLPTPDLSGGTNSKYIHVGLMTATSFTMPTGSANYRYNRLAAYSAALNDLNPPEITLTGVPTNWLPAAQTVNVNASVKDTGLGLAWINATINGTDTNLWGGGWLCSGTYPTPCPITPVNQTVSVNTNNYANGVHTIPVKAIDVVGGTGHTTINNDFVLKVDKNAPRLTTWGGLKETRKPGNTLYIMSEDNTLTSPTYNSNGVLTSSLAPTDLAKLGSGTKNVQVLVDGNSVALTERPCTGTFSSCAIGPVQYDFKASNYSEGTHSITVKTTDWVGLVTQSTWNKTVDRTAPTVTQTVPSAAITSNSVSIPSSSADSGFGIEKVEVMVDGELASSTTENCTTGCPTSASRTLSINTSLLTDGKHTVVTRATGPDGMIGKSEPATLLVDRNAPEIYDFEAQAWANDIVKIELAAANQGAGIASVSLLDGSTVLDTETYDCTPDCVEYTELILEGDVSGLSPGSHNLTLRATPNAGSAINETVDVFIDRTDPEIDNVETKFLSGPNPGLSSLVDIEGTDSGGGLRGISVTIDTQDPVFVPAIPEADATGTNTCGPTHDCEFEFQIPVSINSMTTSGSHDVEVAAVDMAGNRDTISASRTFDTEIPVVSMSPVFNTGYVEMEVDEELNLGLETHDSVGSVDSGIKSVVIRMDGDVIASENLSCSPNCPASWDSTAMDPVLEVPDADQHDLLVEVQDGVGNKTFRDLVINSEEVVPPPTPIACPDTSSWAPSPPVVGSGDSSLALAAIGDSVPHAVAEGEPFTEGSGATEWDPTIALDGGSSGFTVENAPYGSSVGVEGASQIVMGDAICMAPAQPGTQDDPVVTAGNDAAVTAEFMPGVDLLVRGNGAGLSMVHQVNSPAAADNVSWMIGLNENQNLEPLESGGVAITRDGVDVVPAADTDDPWNTAPAAQLLDDPGRLSQIGKTEIEQAELDSVNQAVAVLTAPKVIDANGTLIPSGLEVEGNTVTVTLPENADYPLTVVMSGFSTPNLEEMCRAAFADNLPEYLAVCKDPTTTAQQAHPAAIAQDMKALLRALDPASNSEEQDAYDELEDAALFYAELADLHPEAWAVASRQLTPAQLAMYDGGGGILNTAKLIAVCAAIGIGDCDKMLGDRDRAFQERDENFTNAENSALADGTWANAFQHAYVSALWRKSSNNRSAKLLGFAIEDKQWQPGHDHLTRVRSYMDLWNNMRGRAISAANDGRNRTETANCTFVFYESENAQFIAPKSAYRHGSASRLKFIQFQTVPSNGVRKTVWQRKSNHCAGS